MIIAVIFGYLYEGVGNNATKVLANGVFLYGSNLFLVYTGQMAVVLSCEFQYSISARSKILLAASFHPNIPYSIFLAWFFFQFL